MSHSQPYGYPVQTQVLVPPYRCSTAHVVIAWVLAALTGFYLLPWAVSATRNRSNVAATAMVNLFLGWTLVGWVVALVMACGSDRPVVLVQHTYAQQQPFPVQQPWQPTQQAPQQWAPAPQPPAPAALPAAPTYPVYPSAAEPTMVDPLGTEPTQQLPRSPWERDHLR